MASRKLSVSICRIGMDCKTDYVLQVLFIPEDFVKEIHIHDDRTHIVPFDMEKLKEFFPYWDRVEEIRLSQFWQAQARAIGAAFFLTLVLDSAIFDIDFLFPSQDGSLRHRKRG